MPVLAPVTMKVLEVCRGRLRSVRGGDGMNMDWARALRVA